MKTAGRAASRFAGRVSSAAAKVTAFLGPIALASAALIGIGGVAAGLSFGVKLAAEMEQAEIAFGTVLGSATKAKTVLADLADFASSTPFALQGLQESSLALINAGFTVDEMQDRLRRLADIAAITGKPLGDFTRIISNIKGGGGVVSLDDLRQLGERNIPVFQELAKTFGVTQAEIRKMASAGKFDLADIEGVINNVTDAGGRFADGAAKSSGTLIGLFSTLKDNVGFALMEIGKLFIEIFDFKGIVGSTTSFVQTIKEGIQSIRPVLFAFVASTKAMFSTISSIFAAWGSAIATAFKPVIDWVKNLLSGFGDFQTFAITFFAVQEFAWKNWKDVLFIAFLKVKLGLVKFGNDAKFVFLTLLPKVFEAFSKGTVSFFTNLTTNIGEAMAFAWEMIRTAGQTEAQFVWAPLTDGFKEAFADLPSIASRELSATEKTIQRALKIEQDSFNAHRGAFVQSKINDLLGAAKKAEEAASEVETTASAAAAIATPKTSSIKGTAALERGTAAAFSAINRTNQASRLEKTNDKQLKEQEKMSKGITKIADAVGGTRDINEVNLLAGVF